MVDALTTMGAVQPNLMNLLIVFFLVTFLWQNARAEYGAPCKIKNSNFMGKCVPTSWCKGKGIIEKSCGEFNNVKQICCANNQLIYNEKSIKELMNLGCGITRSPPRVYNGKTVKPWTRPWMAVLKYKTNDINQNAFRCGGTLITNRHVLTAAHCVKGFESELEKVRLREHDLSKECECKKYLKKCLSCLKAIDYDVEKFFIHEDYKRSSINNDIALLRLRRNVNFGKYIKPICLPITPHLQNINITQTTFQISGWGITEKGRASNVLMWAKVDPVDVDECSANRNLEILPSQMCARGVKSDACEGDSGGPLQASMTYFQSKSRFVQFGIVSAGDICDDESKLPGIYTKVSYYLQWITDKMQMD